MEDLIYESNALKHGNITLDEFREHLIQRIGRMSEDELLGIMICHNDVEDEDQRLAELAADQQIAAKQTELAKKKH